MTLFVWNVLLAITWAAAIGSFTLLDVGVGFVVGWFALALGRPLYGDTRYFARSRAIARFVAYLGWELVRASLEVARDVVTLRPRMRPGVVAIPLEESSDAEITALANVITLTPGTLSLDLSEDGRILYVHGMFVGDPDAFRRRLKAQFERRILEMTR